MDETALLRQLRRGDAAALGRAIDEFAPYVMAVVRGRSRGLLAQEDCEEIVSDVFLALWMRAGDVRGPLRPYLGAVARNRTAEALRQKSLTVPLDDAAPLTSTPLWDALCERERREAVRSALAALPPDDREIFARCYDLSQTAAQIADAMGLNASTVRSRLMRGRKRLKKILTEGGYFYEDDLG